jgi:Probable lipoprotein LpqN
MMGNSRRWRVLATGMAAGVAGVISVTGPTASAEPVFPQPPQPAPVTVTQPATAAPNAALTTTQPLGQAPQALSQPNVASATPPLAAGPGGLTTPQVLNPAAVAITPATSGTLTDFFKEKNVKLEPQSSRDFTALNIVLPVPKGWAQVPDPNVPDAFAVIADRVGGNGLYSSNAQLVVYKLVGDFDPKEAISHGFVDSQTLPAWRTTDGSIGYFGGMPSSVIEGTYRENSMTLNTSRRHVIATVGPDHYLLTLSVTTSVDQVVAAADATDAIVRGFSVSVPTPPGAIAPPAAIPPSVAAPLPATTPTPAQAAVSPQLPQALGLPG